MITLLNKFDDGYEIKEKDIVDIIYQYIRDNKLEPYLSDVLFNRDSTRLGRYIEKDKVIELNDERIKKLAHYLYNVLRLKYQIDKKYYSYFLNFCYLCIVYHDLIHVSQRAKYEENSKDMLFNYLYETSLRLRKDKDFYHEHQKLFPMEIDANNRSYFMAYKLIQCTKLPNKENRVLYYNYLVKLLQNYEKTDSGIISPIRKLSYDSSIVDVDKIGELLSNNNLPKIDRINYGLDIEGREYDFVDIRRKIAKTLIR